MEDKIEDKMDEEKFSIGEAIKFGWDTMKENIGFFILVIVVAALIENLPGAIGNFAKDFPLISFFLFFVGWLLGFIVQMGLIKISLKFCDGVRGKLDDLLSSFNLLWKFILSSITYGLIVFGGTLLLVVPGVIWAVKFSLFPYFIVDKGMGPIEAIKASGEATRDTKMHLFLFGLTLGVLNIAGALVLFVGLFATIPTSMIAYAYVYKTLSSKTEDPEEAVEQDSGGGPEPTPEPSFEAAFDVTTDPTPEPSSETAFDVTTDPTSEPSSEAAFDVTSEPIPGPSSEAAFDVTTEPTPEASSETAFDTTYEPIPEATLEEAPETALEAALEEEAPKKSLMESLMKVFKRAPKEEKEEAPKKAPKKARKTGGKGVMYINLEG